MPDRDGRWIRVRRGKLVACTVSGDEFKDDDSETWFPIASVTEWKGMTDLSPEKFVEVFG